MKKVFDRAGTFNAYNDAEKWCMDNNISVASMSSPYPTGLMYGDVAIAKYKNLTAKERRTLDGTITGDFREGPVTVEMRGWKG